MINLPKYVGTAADFTAAVRFNQTPESQVLEFKGEIGEKREDQKKTCRNVAQFANTLGGCLLIGVDWTTVNGMRVASGIKPIVQPDRLQQWIERAITNFLVPATFTRDIVPVTLAEGTVLAINVPPSTHLVSLWDREAHTIEYLYRTSHGKAWMNPDEAERHLMNSSRAAKLNLLAVCDRAPQRRDVEVIGGFWYWTSQHPLGQPQRLPTPTVVRMGTTGD